MNDDHLGAMLDGHDWPAMPSKTRAALQRSVRTSLRPRVHWRVPASIAAALLLGTALGWFGARTSHEPVAIEPVSAIAQSSSPARVVVNAAVFHRPRQNITRPMRTESWGAVRTE